MIAACPACGGRLKLWGTAPDKLTNTGEYPLNRCLNCFSLVLQSPLAGNELSCAYPNDYWYRESDESWLSKLEWRYRRCVLRDHVRFVNRFLTSSSRLLDIGCATGTFLFLLRQLGHQVMGLDFSQRAAVEARERYSVHVEVGELGDHAKNLQQWSPNAVTMFHVLEHLADPVGELRQVHSILPRQGQLFLQVPSIDSWQARLFGARWYGLDVPRHVVNFTAGGFRRVIERAGFQITHHKCFSLRDNSASWASSLLPSVDPLKRRLLGKDSQGANVAYTALVLTLQPVAVLESLCGFGGSLFVRAVKMSEQR